MSSFTYNLNIPNANNNPSVDQPNLQTNTNSINSLINIDHYPFGTGSDGWHKQCTFPTQSTPVTVSGQVAIYSKVGASGSELFTIRDGNAGTETNLTTSKIATPLASTTGYTWLPGGMLMAWGFVNGSHSGHFNSSDSGTVTFPSPLFPNNIYSVQCTLFYTTSAPSNGNAGVILVDTASLASKTSFNWTFILSNPSSSYTRFNWLVIGN
jgi:hypothetical protein